MPMEIIASEVGELKFRGAKKRLRMDLATEPSQPGRLRICFNEGNGRGVYPEDTNYLGLMVTDRGLQIAGMWVDPALRGNGLGSLLVETGFTLAESLEVPLSKTTSIIRKPTIATVLTTFGFKPEHARTEVQFMSTESQSAVPRVRIRTDKQALEGEGKWFEKEEGEFLPNLPTVPIYTPYVLEDMDQCKARRAQVRERLDGVLRIYPRRFIQALPPQQNASSKSGRRFPR